MIVFMVAGANRASSRESRGFSVVSAAKDSPFWMNGFVRWRSAFAKRAFQYRRKSVSSPVCFGFVLALFFEEVADLKPLLGFVFRKNDPRGGNHTKRSVANAELRILDRDCPGCQTANDLVACRVSWASHRFAFSAYLRLEIKVAN
jgi:hypothetical protein